MSVFEYYDWLFFNVTNRGLTQWIEKKSIDIGVQSISDYFSICFRMVKQSPLTDDKLLCFKKEMWKLGKERLAIGLKVNLDDTTTHMIHVLNKTTFTGNDDEKIPYYRINRVVTIPTQPKFSQDNIKVGMKVVMVNKRKTGNVYTVTNTEKNGFDAQNGDYELKMLEYESIDHIVKPKKMKQQENTLEENARQKELEEEAKNARPGQFINTKVNQKVLTKKLWREKIEDIFEKFQPSELQKQLFMQYVEYIHEESKTAFLDKVLNGDEEYFHQFVDSDLENFADDLFQEKLSGEEKKHPDMYNLLTDENPKNKLLLYKGVVLKLMGLSKEDRKHIYQKVFDINVDDFNKKSIPDRRETLYNHFITFITSLSQENLEKFIDSVFDKNLDVTHWIYLKSYNAKKLVSEDITTNVVCVKVDHLRPKYKNLKEWMADSQNVYIGCRGIVFINKVRFPPKNSKFANPFKIGGKLGRSKEKMTRDDVLRLYKEHLENEIRTGKITREEILALKGKTLGCWCSPEPCHGDIIVEMINELSD